MALAGHLSFSEISEHAKVKLKVRNKRSLMLRVRSAKMMNDEKYSLTMYLTFKRVHFEELLFPQT